MTAPSLAARSIEEEWMDGPDAAPEDLARCYADLERLSAVGLAHRPTLGWIARMAAGRERLSILDVGSGGGDMLRRIARWSASSGVAMRLEGIDSNPHARRAAESATDPALGVRYRTGDVFAAADVDADLIVCSHVAHHMSDRDLTRFVRWMQATARRGWLISDLHRHRLAEWGVGALARAMRLHRFVAHDGPVSVRRSFVHADWERVLTEACVDARDVGISWHVPFRWTVGTRP